MKQENLPTNVKKLNQSFETQCRNVIESRLRDYKNGNKDSFKRTINCLIVAECQSGKSLGKASITGVFSSVLENYSQQFRDLGIPLSEGILPLQGMIWMGVTSKQLWKQHSDVESTLQDYKFKNEHGKNVEMNKVIDFTECLHYSKSDKTVGKRLENIRKSLKTQEIGYIVLTDEAHKATGRKQRQNSFITDYNNLESKTPKFRLSVTATPDFLNGKKLSDLHKMFDVIDFLKPGEGYWGGGQGLKDRRIRDINGHINWTMKSTQSAYDFVKSEIFPLWVKHQVSGDYKNFCLRVNGIKKNLEDAIRRVWTENNQDVPPLNYYKSGGYEELLTHIGKDKQHPNLSDNSFRLIELGIEAGVSIDHSVIGMWYETAKPSSKKRNNDDYYHNMSSHIQRVGRNFGYGAGEYSYPIYCDKKCVEDYMKEINMISDYLETFKNPHYTVKHSGSLTKVKKTISGIEYHIKDVIPFLDEKHSIDFSIEKVGHKITPSVRTTLNYKDYGLSILNDRMSSHRTKMISHPIIGKDNHYLCCVLLDNKPDYSLQDKEDTQEVWEDLKNTEWGNLQNKYVGVVVEIVESSHTCENKTMYGDEEEEVNQDIPWYEQVS